MNSMSASLPSIAGSRSILAVLTVVLLLSPAQCQSAGLSAEERKKIDIELEDLAARLRALRKVAGPEKADLLADIEVSRKAVLWALRFETKFEPADVALIRKALRSGRDRAEAVAAGRATWPTQKGKLVRGFVSAVDGSVQPYGLVVPAGYDPGKPIRLDVVLHGSSKPTGMSELRFMSRFENDGKSPPHQSFIELHPLGRVENCYRWAGETDVFEAIEAVCRNYKIDRDRIVLRGMSMGASATWHLGLQHPDRFVAIGPYCGYVDTHEFSRTPLANFVKVGPLPAYQEATLHMLDAIDYAANAGIVPAVACMGDKDVFFQAHVLMGNAMKREGLTMVNLISPGTGHVIDPATHKEQMRRIGEYADKGLDHFPRHLHFVTWTLKYNRCFWLEALGLNEHYQRAELEAAVTNDGDVVMKEPKNITRFALLPPVLQTPKSQLRIGGADVFLPQRDGSTPFRPVIGRRDGKWVYLGEIDKVALSGKRPGLQGPIDDAFTTPFLCVRGTGKPWHPVVQAWAAANLRRFQHEWARYFRGELRIKDDKDVTDDDLRRYNLILFGDPGSNRWIARALPKLAIGWTQNELRVGDRRYAAATHVPMLIHPSPFADGRYVVLNCGHTFHEKELASLNYLLFPRLGDWAVQKVGDNPADPLDEKVIQAGLFDEHWRIPRDSGAK